MDWFLYDNGLRHESVKNADSLWQNKFQPDSFVTIKIILTL